MAEEVTIQSLQKELSDVYAVNAKLVEEIEKLTSQAQQHTLPPIDSFVLDGEQYIITQDKITFKKQVLTKAMICASPELQKQLVEMKVGTLRKRNKNL